MTNWDNVLKSRDITLPTKVRLVKATVFSSTHVQMWELDHKEGWAPKNRCFWTVVLEKTLESPLDCKEIKLINTNGNQSWLFTGGTYVEAEALTFWPPDLSHWKSLWCWERLKAGGERNDRGWDGWMASLTQSTGVCPGDGDGQGNLACCSPWSCKESDMTEQLNWTELDCSLPGISQTRIMEWIAISFFRGSSWPRDWTWVSHLARGFFTIEPPEKSSV